MENFTLLIFCYFILSIFCVVFFYRNHWVYKQRMALTKRISAECTVSLNKDYKLSLAGKKDLKDWVDPRKFFDEYEKRYWGYEKMLLIFWVWNIEKMKKTAPGT